MGQKHVTTKSFFEGRRREAYLRDWKPLKTRGNELRIKMELELPLLNQSLQAMPPMVAEAYEVMVKDTSALSRTALTMACEGMQITFFSTDQILEPSVTVNGVMIDKCVVIATGEQSDRRVDLHITAYMPALVQLREEWLWQHLHATVYTETVYSQSEMLLKDGEDDEFEDEEPEEDNSDAEPEEESAQMPLVH